jgi:hypothetical protein
MKLDPRYYPIMILITFAIFMLIGILLGFRPQHEGGRGRTGFLPVAQYVLVTSETLAWS